MTYYSRVGWHFILAMLISKEANSVVIDLGHSYRSHATTCWEPTEQFEIYGEQKETGSNGWYTTESFSTSEHCGTHLDAPYHFYQEGWKLDEIPLDRMIVEGIHLNVSGEVNGNGDFSLTADHLKAWEHKNGRIPYGSVILINFGWAHKFGDRQTYYNNETATLGRLSLGFPGLSKDAARWIVDSGRGIYGVGVDGPSVDPGSAVETQDAHKILSKANLYIIENVALNGTTLPPKGFKLIVQPIKIIGGTGGPCRILAFTDNSF